LVPLALTAQSPRPYRPEFDVQDYALSIDLPDTGATLHGTAVLTIRRVAKADTLRLDFLDLDVDHVNVDGAKTGFVRSKEQIAIRLPSRNTTATFRVEVAYRGTVTDGLIVRQDRIRQAAGPTSATTGRTVRGTGSRASIIRATRRPSPGA
jgi:aminopeptidase N